MFLAQLTQEGKYRIKIRAGAFAGKGQHAVEQVKVQFEFGKDGDTANSDRASVVIDAPLDPAERFCRRGYLHPKPEIAAPIKAHLYWNGIPSGTQAVIDGKLVQTGLVVRAPELFQFEDECVGEHDRIA